MAIKRGQKLKERPKTSCIFYGKPQSRRFGLPMCTLTTYEKCEPDTCTWYKNQEMMDASYEKARENYKKRYGRDEYYELGFGPKMRQNPRIEPDDKEEQAE